MGSGVVPGIYQKECSAPTRESCRLLVMAAFLLWETNLADKGKCFIVNFAFNCAKGNGLLAMVGKVI